MRLGVSAAITGDRYVPGDVAIDRDTGVIEAVGLSPAGPGVACPGLVDLQVNGFAGVDFALATDDDYDRAGLALAARGVTAYQATLISGPLALMKEGVETATRARQSCRGARIIGVHLEGPFLSPQRCGAHDAASLLPPDLHTLAALVTAGSVTQVTLAPELPGAAALIHYLRAAGVAIACGHSDATASQAHAAFDRGAGLVTHLFNAMRPFHHREPGLVGAALTRDVTLTLIADAHHVERDAVLLAFSAGAGRTALISDASAASGAKPGSYTLGGERIVSDGQVARRADGTLAGPIQSLWDGVRRVVEMGVPLETAVASATSIPARALRIPGVGQILPTGPADVVVFDDALEIRRVLRAGGDVQAAAGVAGGWA